jgi:hypothetical protein
VIISFLDLCAFDVPCLDLILFWFPFYFYAKIALLLWMMAPIEKNGSQVCLLLYITAVID